MRPCKMIVVEDVHEFIVLSLFIGEEFHVSSFNSTLLSNQSSSVNTMLKVTENWQLSILLWLKLSVSYLSSKLYDL